MQTKKSKNMDIVMGEACRFASFAFQYAVDSMELKYNPMPDFVTWIKIEHNTRNNGPCNDSCFIDTATPQMWHEIMIGTGGMFARMSS